MQRVVEVRGLRFRRSEWTVVLPAALRLSTLDHDVDLVVHVRTPDGGDVRELVWRIQGNVHHDARGRLQDT